MVFVCTTGKSLHLKTLPCLNLVSYFHRHIKDPVLQTELHWPVIVMTQQNDVLCEPVFSDVFVCVSVSMYVSVNVMVTILFCICPFKLGLLYRHSVLIVVVHNV